MSNIALAVCALCTAGNPVATSGSLPEPVEPPDFDTRPGEPLRGTIFQWVQNCKSCGYSAEDISKASEQAQIIVSSVAYQSLRDLASIPAAARPFLCYAHLLDKLHQSADSGWSCLHAAWICDDVPDPEAASECRLRAIDVWKRGKQAGQQFGDDMASEFALITDIYRRTGQFEEATFACSEGLDIDDIPAAVEAVLRRQLTLIQSRDTDAHSLSELLRER